MRVNLTLAETSAEYKLGFTDEAEFLIAFDSGMTPMPCPTYAGPYEVTPTRQTQILPTAGKLMLEAVTANPIPKNYGLITYNGFEIMVS